MIPGMGKLTRNLDIQDDAFKHVKALIQSMTAKERENPRLLNGSRRRRIAEGAGRPVREVNDLLKHFEQMKKTMRQMNKMQGGGKMRAMRNMNMLGKRR
jgi:signal recognition particle subunit SRP54